MSTPAAAARYTIVADDKTKAAVASVQRGFQQMERGVKGTVARLNAALGLIAGVGVKRAFQNVFTETAKQSKEFAGALDDVKRASRNLLAAKDGAPAAAAAMRELAEVLKDPAVVAAADAISSAFIRGAAGTVRFALGVQTLQEELAKLKAERAALQSGNSTKFQQHTFMVTRDPDASKKIYEKNIQIAAKEQEIAEALLADQKKKAADWARILAASEEVTRRFEQMQRIRNLIADSEEQLKNLDEGSFGDAAFWEQASREGDVAAGKDRNRFFEDMDAAARDVGETMERTGDSIDQVGDAIGRSIDAEMWSDWAEAGKEAVRGIQRATVDWLMNLDNTRDSLKGLVDLLRQIALETAVSGLFKPKAQGGAGFGDALSGFIGGLFGGATGKSTGPGLGAYLDAFSDPVPKYATGIDFVPRDQLALVHRGERIIPAHANKGSAPNVNIVTNIDARGATQDAIKALPEVLKRNNDALEARIVSRLRSGKYG